MERVSAFEPKTTVFFEKQKLPLAVLNFVIGGGGFNKFLILSTEWPFFLQTPVPFNRWFSGLLLTTTTATT